MKSNWRRAIAGVVLLALLTGVAVPTTLLFARDGTGVNKETQVVITSFVERYGRGSQLLNVQNPQRFYIVYRQDGQAIRVSMFIEGLWVELGTISAPGESGEGKD